MKRTLVVCVITVAVLMVTGLAIGEDGTALRLAFPLALCVLALTVKLQRKKNRD